MGLADSARGLWDRLKGHGPQQDAAIGKTERRETLGTPSGSASRKGSEDRETLRQSRQKEAGPAERIVPDHADAVRNAAAAAKPQAPKRPEIEATRMEFKQTAQPALTPNMGGMEFVNKRAQAPRPPPANDPAKSKPAQEKAGPAAEPQKPVPTINDFRRRSESSHDRKPPTAEQRPADKLIDQYRRGPPDIGRSR